MGNVCTICGGKEKEGMEGMQGPDQGGREEAQRMEERVLRGGGKRRREKLRTAHKKQRTVGAVIFCALCEIYKRLQEEGGIPPCPHPRAPEK